MVELPEAMLPTVDKIFSFYEKNSGDWRRDHLGASLIGRYCERSLWYTFRWCSNPNFNGRVLRLFETGNRQESRLVKNLRDVGCTVYDRDPETGLQIYYEEFGGHFAGSLDGIACGFEESSQWHVLEFKTANTKSFNALKKNGVEKSKYEHYTQMQMYMHWSGLERAYYFCVNKESDDIYGERVYYNKDIVKKLIRKAESVIFSDEPFIKLSDSSTIFTCKFCDHKDLCYENKLPEVSCRTCANSTPERNGTWTCKDEKICSYQQRQACEKHIFLPCTVPLEQTDADSVKGIISYGLITNGPGEIASKDLQGYIQ
jgi:hypothetical protein